MRSQSSTEFMVFIGIAIIILLSYFAIAHTYLNITYKQKDIISGQDLAKQIKNEINLAARVENNYERSIKLPEKISGKDYSISVGEREISITIDGNDYVELLMVDVNPQNFEPGDAITISKTNEQVAITVNIP